MEQPHSEKEIGNFEIVQTEISSESENEFPNEESENLNAIISLK